MYRWRSFDQRKCLWRHVVNMIFFTLLILACLPLSTRVILQCSQSILFSLLLNMANCCVPKCSNYSSKRKDQGITYHRIPSEATTHKARIERIRWHSLPPLKNYYVCSTHFANDCFEFRAQLTGETNFRRVTGTVVPSIFHFNKLKAYKRRTSDYRLQRKKIKEVR